MDILVFTTVEGHEVAIPDDDIQALWRGKDGKGTLIERLSDNPNILIDYDFDALIREWFDSIDLRPKKAKKAKKRAAPKAKKSPLGNNIMAWDAVRKRMKRCPKS